jgi:hypothetical protein
MRLALFWMVSQAFFPLNGIRDGRRRSFSAIDCGLFDLR